MDEKKGVVVELKRSMDGSQSFSTGAKSLPEMYFDLGTLSEEEKAGEHLGARILMCAALSCYTNTFTNGLKAAGAKVRSISASATIEKEKDEILRTRYMQMHLHIDIDMDESDRAVFERVRANMEQGSLLTYSLEEGIEMDYNVRLVSGDQV